MSNWITKSNFYHIYPLGFCGAEKFRSEFVGEPKPRIRKIIEWIPHLVEMNFNALYLGPLFESVKHGYDTIDYKKVDARLGTNADFTAVCKELKANGIKIILDGVFNHVGRDFFAFEDLRQNKQNSRYKDWFSGVNFGGNSPYNDGFGYEAWSGHYELVKLNLYNGEVVDYLLSAIKFWIDEWDIDGIRFDAADCLTDDFIKRVRSFTKNIRPDFWLMGEIIHGVYSRWANNDMFDSVTNYQCYKGIYSSHNDRNFFEIAHTINYQKQQNGELYLYNFLDNHDVERLSSVLSDKSRAACCYTFMYMMSGIPSVYYGSEFGIDGKKGHGENADDAIRPNITLEQMKSLDVSLAKHISKLGEVRNRYEILQTGSYAALDLKNQTFSFKREKDGKSIYIAINISDGDYTFSFDFGTAKATDVLSGKVYSVNNGRAEICLGKNCSAVIVEGEASFDGGFEVKAEAKTEAPVVEIDIKAAIENATESNVEFVDCELIEIPVVEIKSSCVSAGTDKGNGTRGVGVPDGRGYKLFGKYKHFKGGVYVLINVAKDHETCEEMAIYMSISENPQVWVRPLSMFIEDVDDHGNIRPRFELCD